MSFKEKSFKYLMLIPHLAFFFDMRKYQRFVPREGLDIKIASNNKKIYAVMIDISQGGVRILSTDTRIKDSKRISISVNNFLMELPCEIIRRVQYHYGIKFGTMDEYENSNLHYFIDHCTQRIPNSGLTEIMR